MNFNIFSSGAISENMAADLGSSNTRIYLSGKGCVLDEPTYIAWDDKNNELSAVGEEARQMYGKEPVGIRVIRPILNGVVADSEKAVIMMREFIKRVCPKSLLKPQIIVSIPSGSTSVEKNAFAEVCRNAGAREVFVMEETLAAAEGAGCDISMARGMLIADIGGGSCDVSSLSLGRTVISKSIPAGGDAFTREIMKYIKKAHNLNIGFLTAENLKHKIGSAYPSDKLSKSERVCGCDIQTGMPKEIIVTADEIREVFAPLVSQIARAVKTTLEETPPELQSDISEDGMLITGGGAKTVNLDYALSLETGIKVYTAPECEYCAAKGLGIETDKLSGRINEDKFYYSLYDER